MCPHSKVLLRNYKTQETKFLDVSYFDFLAQYEKILHQYLNGGLLFLRGFNPSGCEIIPIDCGKCAYCKKKKINNFKFKLRCESKTCQSMCHLTLTFSEQFLNNDYSLVQRCFKRVRKNLDKKFKYFLVSEHGTQNTCRLHYHILIFGLSPQETKELFKKQWYYGFIKVKPFEDRQIGYLVNYIFKQDEIRRQSQKLGYGYWFNCIKDGIIRLNGFKYNFPYYFRKKYFNSVNLIMNVYRIGKIKKEIEDRYLKIKRKGNEILAKYLKSESEQKNLECCKWFEKLGYKV